MARLLFGLGVAAVIFTIYAVADCAFFDRTRIRGLRRGWWIVIIIFVPIIGGVLWFLIGRGRANRMGASRGGRTLAPDDDVEFLRQ
ncbi:MAG TPA: PLDc N-terminal domain-containing protein, partial [Agromyces sp.]